MAKRVLNYTELGRINQTDREDHSDMDCMGWLVFTRSTQSSPASVN